MIARWLSMPMFLLLACGGRSVGPPPVSRTAVSVAAPTAATPLKNAVTFIVFADVTRSLTEEEERSVIDNVQKVIDVLPPRSKFMLFPILEDVERSTAIVSREILDVETTSDAVAADTQRSQLRKQAAVDLAAVLHGRTDGRNRTCISGALRKAEELTADVRGSVELVLVSDMLEDCRDSLLGGPLRLQKSSITEELNAARSIRGGPLVALHGASVTVVLPTVPTSGEKVARPPVHELKAFWRAVLDNCGDRQANYRFGTGVPNRLQDYRNRSDGGL